MQIPFNSQKYLATFLMIYHLVNWKYVLVVGGEVCVAMEQTNAIATVPCRQLNHAANGIDIHAQMAKHTAISVGLAFEERELNIVVQSLVPITRTNMISLALKRPHPSANLMELMEILLVIILMTLLLRVLVSKALHVKYTYLKVSFLLVLVYI